MTEEMVTGRAAGAPSGGLAMVDAGVVSFPGPVVEGVRDAGEEQPTKPNRRNKKRVSAGNTRKRDFAGMGGITLAVTNKASSRNSSG
jgi:hypothetical protein